MQFKCQKDAEVTVNLTPLIDVVFLLLIFFMVSTSFTKESHLSLDLPEASAEPEETVKKSIEIIITANSQYIVNDRNLVNNRPDTLQKALLEVAAGDSSQPLVITADANSPHQAVITAMDVAGQLGFSQLSLTTTQSTD